jgi:hypothetical protein
MLRRLALVLAGIVVAVMPRILRAQTGTFAVVVHPDVAIDSLPLVDLRRVLLGDREFWSPGVRITLFIRAPIAGERDAAVKTVCQMTEAQFRQHWIGKVFRADTQAGPRIVYSNDMAIDQVSRTPGALAFIATPVTAKNVKVLKIDGKLPGQAGYPIR